MLGIRRVVLIISMLVIATITIAFILENQQETSLSLYGWTTGSLPASVFITGAFLLGLAVAPIGMLIGRVLKLRSK
ncbi:DUF1049 domain-containing protein [Pseudomonas sp. EYE_354]|nr:DUF1049 domain-containing protein [Pseudomonas sp. EYE_354]